MFKSLFLLNLAIMGCLAHRCISNQPNITLSYIPSTAPPKDSPPPDRVLQESYENIRIHTDFTYVPTDNPQVSEYIQNQIVPSAVSYFESTLKVNRLQQPLTVGPDCQGLASPQNLVSPGVDKDIIILVGADYYETDFVAFAIPCGLSEVDNRPSYGILVYNLKYMPIGSVAANKENLATTLHEMTHIFGFGAALYPYFIDPVARTLQTNQVGSKVVNGVNTYYLNVEPLTSRLRTYYGCDSVEGAYLENEGTESSAGSHFERRVFMNEFMTASSIVDPVISEFTLALLEGSGWYQVNYNMTEPFNWGRNQGCSFLDGSCVGQNAAPNFEGFCGSLGSTGCTFSGKARAVCGVEQGMPAFQGTTYPQFNYWGDGTAVMDQFADNCPYFVGNPYSDCENPIGASQSLLNEETYGQASRCFTGTLVPPLSQPAYNSYCFSTKCKKQDNGNYVVMITIGVNLVTCRHEGPVSLNGLEGQLNCPDPNTFCHTSNPQYCEKGCSGRGECVDNVCQCPEGWEGVDCDTRKYAKDCVKCAGAPVLKDCYGDECVCDQNDQFCQNVSFKKKGPSITVNNATSNSSEDATNTESLRQALKNMMEPFLSHESHNEH